MELKEFTSTLGSPIAIPTNKITGFTSATAHGKTFIATGADDPEGGENGWYVKESYEEVKAILQE